jgi:hypothetical protein
MIRIAFVIITAIVLASCAKGPAGPDPGQELIIREKVGFTEVETRKTSDMIIKDKDGKMTSTFTLSTLLDANHIRFLAAATPSPLVKPLIKLYYGASNPTPATTQEWKAADLSSGNPNLVKVDVGPEIFWNGNTYFPVEGETVYTSAAESGGRITLAAGYFNGTVRAVNGDELVIESCVFYFPKP